MPWKECSAVEERLRCVARRLDGESMTDLCREFGISRKTGYKIFDRYKDHGLTIAKLADTLRDRSVIIPMRRMMAGESIEAWNEDDTDGLAELRRKLLRCTEDQAEVLKRAFPEVPKGLDNRAADNWGPLLAIADAGGEAGRRKPALRP
jgi:transposase-like protein